MLAVTRRPSATTPGIVENLPSSSTSCATAGRRRARAHRDADVGVLQRQRVVDAVAGHRDDVPARLQRLDHRPLLVRRHPTEHGVLLEHLGELVEVLGKLAGVDRPIGAGSPTRAATAPTVRGCRRR